jgi:uncharacterized protein GlcG (DUF336 family)
MNMKFLIALFFVAGIVTNATSQEERTPRAPSPELLRELERQNQQELRRMQDMLRGVAPDGRPQNGARPLSLDLAMEIARITLGTCRSMDLVTSVTVADTGYVPKVQLQDDKVALWAVHRNEKKIRLVLENKLASREALERNDKRFRAMGTNGMARKDMDELPGGFPIRIKGELIGALAVSGSANTQRDEECATAAMSKIGGLDPL